MCYCCSWREILLWVLASNMYFVHIFVKIYSLYGGFADEVRSSGDTRFYSKVSHAQSFAGFPTAPELTDSQPTLWLYPFPVPRGVGRSLREGTRVCEPLQSLTSQPHVNSASGGQLFSQPLPNLTVRLRNGGGGSLWEIVSSRMFLKTVDLHPVFKGNPFDVSHLSCLFPPIMCPPMKSPPDPKGSPEKLGSSGRSGGSAHTFCRPPSGWLLQPGLV